MVYIVVLTKHMSENICSLKKLCGFITKEIIKNPKIAPFYLLNTPEIINTQSWIRTAFYTKYESHRHGHTIICR